MIPCPPGLSYLPYQEEGIAFGCDKTAVLFGDEMGLGKTIQAIGWLNCHPEIETCLVVCPASLKINWARELDKWLISPCIDVTIINYDMLHKTDLSKSYDVCILDEAHYIKNNKARRSQLCRLIRATHRIALTGTPILNRPIELWNVLHWLDQACWPTSSYMPYAIRYCGAFQRQIWVRGGGKRRVWMMDGASNLDELRALLRPLMIRRLKADVLTDLPAKRRQIIELPAIGLSADLRRRLRDGLQQIRDLEVKYRDDVQKLESSLQVAWSRMAEVRHEAGLAKVQMALELIQDAIDSSGKVVLFAHHRDVIDQLQEALVDYRPAVITGETPLVNRQIAVDMFQRDPGVKVFIGQIQAAGVGITLTAASHVIFVELDWTPGMVSQAEDRCHRIGQKESVLVQHLALEDSIDVHMAKALVRKQSTIERALDGAGKGDVAC